jgi:hypothetical protein
MSDATLGITALNDVKHTVYFATARGEEHQLANSYVLNRLVRDFGLTVVGDHPAYMSSKHERGLRYRDRVEEILKTCSGMVLVFPKKDYEQTTSPYMFLELLLAIKNKIPALLFCEADVICRWAQSGDEVMLSFGDKRNDGKVVSIQALEDANFRVQSLRDIFSIRLDLGTFCNNPIHIDHPLADKPALHNSVLCVCDEFLNNLNEPRNNGHVFNIIRYGNDLQRQIIANAVFEETGLYCLNGSDEWSGAP